MDKIISKGVSKGQSFYHIMHSNNLVVSKSSLYRYVNNGYFSIDSVDCKRIVKFRKRNKVNKEAIPKHLKSGRAYINFLDFMNESAMPFHLEMDTIIGKRGGKTLLTFNVSSCNFMFALLLDSNTSSEVSSKLYNLKEKFYQNNIHFSDIFPVATDAFPAALFTYPADVVADIPKTDTASIAVTKSTFLICYSFSLFYFVYALYTILK